ncbi:MAG: 16S rRNA (cytosine(1402)-N(4))-methyltransferase RsmH [Actinomycetia bacterium]|nr:16S rRNA (cytosine(1402)-N(4))-methyltransferase RsmH [Actinomycetes bacterium]
MSTLKLEYRHEPVMLERVTQLLALLPGEIFCDCTLGGGGHSLALAPQLLPDGLLIGIDQDAQALAVASQRLQNAQPELDYRFHQGNFADLDAILVQQQIPGVDAFLFDLGLSSFQIDTPERGFAYAQAAPLDMRMDPGNQTLTAAEVVNTKNVADLTWILSNFGEERWAARIAAAIVRERQRRPYVSTDQLVDTIQTAIPAAGRRRGGHPAKRSFQALRIYVNDELRALEQGLEAAMRWLNPAGRLVVLSYHSLEDRLVKRMFAAPEPFLGRRGQLPPSANNTDLPSVFEILTPKPETPAAGERAFNPRSASAKLRAIRKPG